MGWVAAQFWAIVGPHRYDNERHVVEGWFGGAENGNSVRLFVVGAFDVTTSLLCVEVANEIGHVFLADGSAVDGLWLLYFYLRYLSVVLLVVT